MLSGLCKMERGRGSWWSREAHSRVLLIVAVTVVQSCIPQTPKEFTKCSEWIGIRETQNRGGRGSELFCERGNRVFVWDNLLSGRTPVQNTCTDKALPLQSTRPFALPVFKSALYDGGIIFTQCFFRSIHFLFLV